MRFDFVAQDSARPALIASIRDEPSLFRSSGVTHQYDRQALDA
jgi:hypothetical protein